MVRQSAANALSGAGVHAVEPLIGALKDSDWAVRHNAASALGDIGTAAIGPLMAALKGPNSVAPQDVLEAWAQIKDPGAFSTLLAAFPAMVECKSSHGWRYIFDTRSKGWKKKNKDSGYLSGYYVYSGPEMFGAGPGTESYIEIDPKNGSMKFELLTQTNQNLAGQYWVSTFYGTCQGSGVSVVGN